jgi:hypothetical protein
MFSLFFVTHNEYYEENWIRIGSYCCWNVQPQALLESCLCEVESIVGLYYSKECGHEFYHTLIKHSGELTKFVKFWKLNENLTKS